MKTNFHEVTLLCPLAGFTSEILERGDKSYPKYSQHNRNTKSHRSKPPDAQMHLLTESRTTRTMPSARTAPSLSTNIYFIFISKAKMQAEKERERFSIC